MRRRLGVAAAGLLVLAGPAAAQEIQSRYTRLDAAACRVAESGEDLGQDWLLHRCDGADGVAVWMLYQDSTRLQVGFGRQDFDRRFLPWSNQRDAAWPVEWRGRAGGPPFAAILRLTPLHDVEPTPASQLAVFRVWPDRPDCYLGVAATNAQARRLADDAEAMTDCPSD